MRCRRTFLRVHTLFGCSAGAHMIHTPREHYSTLYIYVVCIYLAATGIFSVDVMLRLEAGGGGGVIPRGPFSHSARYTTASHKRRSTAGHTARATYTKYLACMLSAPLRPPHRELTLRSFGRSRAQWFMNPTGQRRQVLKGRECKQIYECQTGRM